MVFMNSWNIEQYGAGVGDDFDNSMVIMNFSYSKHYGARVGDDLVAKKNNFNQMFFFDY